MKPVTAAAAAVALYLTLTASSCATLSPPDPKVVIRTVYVPTPVRCSPDVPAAPSYPDTDAALKAAPNLTEWAKLLVAGRALRIAREAALLSGLDACEGSSPPPEKAP